ATQSSTPGYLPVKIEHVEGGYGTIPSQLLTKIQAQDTKTLPNLYIDYAAGVGMIQPYEMAFDASTSVLKRDLFESEFVKVNDKIAGVKKGTMFSVPLSKSTEALIYDKPVLKYLFDGLNSKRAGTVVGGTSNPIIQSILSSHISSADRSEIAAQWGAVNKKVNMDITDDIFKDFTSLNEFVTQVGVSITNPGGANLLGIDSPSNYVYALSSLMTKNKSSDFLMAKNDKTGFVDFNFLHDGAQKSIFTKVYDKFIKKPIEQGSLWVGGGGAYGSTRLSKHQMAISLGSSAGLKHSHSSSREKNFLNKEEVGLTSPPDHLYSQAYINAKGIAADGWDKVTTSISQGPSFNTVHINKHEDNASKKFLEWFYTGGRTTGLSDKPSTYFAKHSEYIVPLKGAFDVATSPFKSIVEKDYQHLSDDEWGLKMSFDTIHRQLENNKKYNTVADKPSMIFEPPVDDSTGAMRKVIDSKIKASSNSQSSGGGAYSGLNLWKKIHDQAVIDNVIEGELNKKEYNYPNQMNRNFSDIDWNRYQYVDGYIQSWTDGDTPNIIVDSTHSTSKALNSIHPGDKLAIRISGIDTPEAHVKLGEIKRKVLRGITSTAEPLSDQEVETLIDKYRTDGHPLAVYSNGHYNELHYKDESAKYSGGYSKYTDWRNIYVDIQTGDISTDASRLVGYDSVLEDPTHPNSTYDLRTVKFPDGRKLVSDLATTEGYWGLKAGDFGRKEIPVGTKVRVATDGKKSYNRIVGSIFYGNHLEKNWSVEITKTGLTLPFIGDIGAVTEPTNILWENGQAIADAFNSAISKKLGLFNYSSGTLDEHLKWLLTTHGATDYANLLHGSSGTSIYDYMKYRNPVREPVTTTGGTP
ncbi:MAG: P80 family lipoprotein, partial [Mycoplasmataceae bacterium]|nr:P80 family lipoprotein [Mycoplasmataceae bacterium]